MRRRCALACLLSTGAVALARNAAAAGAAAAEAPASPTLPRFLVPLDRLQTEVAQRFPLQYPVPGLVNFSLDAPQLALLPAQNRLRADMAVTAAGPALVRSQQGRFTVDFGLRYEHSDRSLRAHQLKVYAFRFPGLSAQALELLNQVAPALAEQTLREVVLYQLQPEQRQLADLLGLRPGALTVTEQGLRVELERKPL